MAQASSTRWRGTSGRQNGSIRIGFTRVPGQHSQGEDVYDRHLREFLFREGFNMPYSQQRSPSGQSDVTSNLESDDALVCELKVYDGANRDIGHLAEWCHAGAAVRHRP